MKQVILETGQQIHLDDYQSMRFLSDNQVGEHFQVSELQCRGDLLIAEPLLKLLDAFRNKIGKPVVLNSGYRSRAKQDELREQGYKAATHSPHCVGMAADIETKNAGQTRQYARTLRHVANELGIRIRLGYEQYLKNGQTFVHVDVCPEYYGIGKPFHSQSHPHVWELQIEW